MLFCLKSGTGLDFSHTLLFILGTISFGCGIRNLGTEIEHEKSFVIVTGLGLLFLLLFHGALMAISDKVALVIILEGLYMSIFGIVLLVFAILYMNVAREAPENHGWRVSAATLGILNGLVHIWVALGFCWCVTKGFKDFSPKGGSNPPKRCLDYVLPSFQVQDV